MSAPTVIHRGCAWLVAGIAALTRGPRAERGTTVMEFGLIAPILFGLIYGIVEFGRVMFTQGVLLYAAQEATRYAVVNYDATTEQIRDIAESKFIMIDPSGISEFDVQAPLDETDQTKLVTVQIRYSFHFLAPLVSENPVELEASSKGFLIED